MANVAETSPEIVRRSASLRPPARRGDPPPSGATIALLSPAYGWLLVAVFLPLLAMLAFSFLTATPLGNKPLVFTINNYLAFERRPYLVGVAWESLKLGLWTTGFCAVLGLPAALALARAGRLHVARRSAPRHVRLAGESAGESEDRGVGESVDLRQVAQDGRRCRQHSRHHGTGRRGPCRVFRMVRRRARARDDHGTDHR